MMQPLTGNPAQSTHRVIRRHRTWQTVHWTIAPVRCVNITNAIQFVSKQPTRQLKQLHEQQIDSSSVGAIATSISLRAVCAELKASCQPAVTKLSAGW